MEFRFRGVNDAFAGLVRAIHDGQINCDKDPYLWRVPVPLETRASRYGEVVMVDEPVTVHYSHPRERVLFNAARDCNPFALLYEALWTLAGRNDVAPLAYYFKRAAEFSDNNVTWNDAYGHRWRHAPGKDRVFAHKLDRGNSVDQLKVIIDHLRSCPESRRAVLQMWNVEDDLLKINDSRAVCCNLSVLFSVGLGDCPRCCGEGFACPTCNGQPHDRPHHLDMTVLNRSNDLVWGLLGANYVTFSVLQEYVAAHLGLEVGRYTHFTNNLHACTADWKPEAWLADDEPDYYGREARWFAEGRPQRLAVVTPFPLVRDPVAFDRLLPAFVDRHKSGAFRGCSSHMPNEPFLKEVAHPMFQAFHYRKDEPAESDKWAARIAADDWRIACQAWLKREVENAATR